MRTRRKPPKTEGFTDADGKRLSLRDERRALGILARMFEYAVQNGEVSVEGKSESQIHDEYAAFLVQLASVDEFRPVVDHTPDLLRIARRISRDDDSRLATLLYATWVEHWVNGLVRSVCQRRGMPIDDVVEVVRETSLRSKTGWLLRLLGLKPLAPSHRNAILRLAELRNSFVHYKWKPIPEDALEELDRSYNAVADAFPKTVSYLHRYETEQLFGKAKRKLRRTVMGSTG